MPIAPKGKCHQQTEGMTTRLKGIHARRNDSDGYFSIAVAVDVSDVGPRTISKLINFHFQFLSFRRFIFWKRLKYVFTDFVKESLLSSQEC